MTTLLRVGGREAGTTNPREAKTMKKLTVVAALAAIGTLLQVLPLAGQQNQAYPDVLNELKHDTSPPMRDIHPAAETGPNHVIKLMHTPHQIKQGQLDPVVQTSAP